MPTSTVDVIRQHADRAGVTVSEFIRNAVDARIDDTERTPLDAA